MPLVGLEKVVGPDPFKMVSGKMFDASVARARGQTIGRTVLAQPTADR